VAELQYAALVNCALRRSWVVKSGLFRRSAAVPRGMGGIVLVVLEGVVVVLVGIAMVVVFESVVGVAMMAVFEAEVEGSCRGYKGDIGAAYADVKNVVIQIK
jgi:hypothetical protein